MKRLVVLLSVLLLAAVAVDARVGGGSSYSGGGGSSSSGGSGGDGGGGEIVWLLIRFLFWLTIEYPLIGIPVDIIVIVFVVRWWLKPGRRSPVTVFANAIAPKNARSHVTALRRYDPNFSEIVLRDFLYSLYGRVHHARGAGQLDQYALYLSKSARAELRQRGTAEVTGIIVGALHLDELRGLDGPNVILLVRFESNMTEGGTSWYVTEKWMLERKRDILSPTPEKAKADHCPRCGAPLQTRTDGACHYCGVKIESGEFHWFVRAVVQSHRESRGPLLTSNVPEQGTHEATVYQPNFAQQRGAFEVVHPDFSWEAFRQRVTEVATTLQAAWSARDWERVRPLETEGLFQMHRYWIDAYRAQKLRNLVDDFAITNVEPVKIDHDAFYESITVRIRAQGRDYTVSDDGQIVGGSRDMRFWSEYWTFIRTRTASTAPNLCPNCGARITVGATAICDYCGGKLTSGTFDWILSSIEQDEAYSG
ncbi:MAG TPA: TIM44-like domain-containing protein [Thermoanaerobaculia bacterium]|jgi:uncharacterized Zn finger protein (UPF0148 family)